jgi:hypothetical protein
MAEDRLFGHLIAMQSRQMSVPQHRVQLLSSYRLPWNYMMEHSAAAFVVLATPPLLRPTRCAAAQRVAVGRFSGGVAVVAAAGGRHRPAVMCEDKPPPVQQSAADRTRAALSAEKPLVKFRRSTDDDADQNTSFAYTSGTTGGGVDVWLISSVLLFLVPVVVFAVGVATGYIDVNPR